MSMNCLSCKNYDKCEAQYKSATTSCTQWTDGTTAVIDLNEANKNSRIITIEMGTVEYVIEKIIDAISSTLNNMAYPDINENGYEVMCYKDYIEMFADFSNQLVNILNEIKESNKR